MREVAGEEVCERVALLADLRLRLEVRIVEVALEGAKPRPARIAGDGGGVEAVAEPSLVVRGNQRRDGGLAVEGHDGLIAPVEERRDGQGHPVDILRRG